MTIGRARASLAIFWVVSVGLMFLIISLLTITDRFKANWDLPWNWFLPLTCPTVGLIISIIKFSDDQTTLRSLKTPSTFWLIVFLSVIYIAVIYAVVIVQPYTGRGFESLARASGWFLGPLQGLVCAGIGKLFIDNA